MHSSSVIFVVYVVCIVVSSIGGGGVGHCDTIAFEPGISYSWIIPPQSRPSVYESTSSSSSSAEAQHGDYGFRSTEAPVTPVGGYGHPPFYLRHSHEQLTLPNEFLITPSDPQRYGRGSDSGGGSGGGLILSNPPIFQQLDPVDCNGGPPTCPNVDIAQQQLQLQQHATTMHQSNIAPVPAIPPTNFHTQQRSGSSAPVSLGQTVTWPRSHGGNGGGGIGLLFFIPESASHLPVEQLIHQQLALHRTQFPFDISINCEDSTGPGCRPGNGFPLHPSPPPAAFASNGRNVENGNYASKPLVEIVNNSNRRRGSSQQQQQQRKWRTTGERIVRNNQYLNRMQQQKQQRQRQSEEQNQRELSILP